MGKNIEHRTLNAEQRRNFIPRIAWRNDDPNGVEEQSPGLAESSRTTLGPSPVNLIHFARSAASTASIS